MNDERYIDNLIDAYINGDATPDQINALDQLISSSSELCDIFRKRIVIEAGLCDIIRRNEGAHNFVSGGKSAESEESILRALSQAAKNLPVAVVDFTEEEKRRTLDSKRLAFTKKQKTHKAKANDSVERKREIIIPTWAAWGVPLVAAVLIFMVTTTTSDKKIIPRNVQLIGNHIATFHMIDGSEIKRTSGNGKIRGVSLTAGEYLLTKGLAKVYMDDGVSVIVAAPAKLNLVDGQRMYLHNGSLTIQGTQAAKETEFKVETDNAMVTNIDAEFGVNVNVQGATQTRVFKGFVTCSSNKNTTNELDKTYVSAGRAVSVDGSREDVRDVDVESLDFIRTGEYLARDLKGKTGKDKWAACRASLRHDPSLLIDLDFIDKSNMLLNQAYVTKNKIMPISGDTSVSRIVAGRWPRSQALDFSNRSEHCIYFKKWPEAFNGPEITFMAWVDVANIEGITVLASQWTRMPLEEKDSFFHLGVIGPGGIGLPNVPILPQNSPSGLHLKFAENAQNEVLSFNEIDKGSSLSAEPEWVFVAFTVDTTGNVNFYKDNKKWEGRPLRGYKRSSRALVIGGKDAYNGGGVYFTGTLDELLVFDRALSAKEIKEIYKAGTPDSLIKK